MTSRSRRLSAQSVAVLSALADAGDDWTYGLVLARATGLKSGTLYPILLRLSDRGLLDGAWQAPERPGRPARHGYRLNGAGRAALRDALRGPAPLILRGAPA